MKKNLKNKIQFKKKTVKQKNLQKMMKMKMKNVQKSKILILMKKLKKKKMKMKKIVFSNQYLCTKIKNRIYNISIKRNFLKNVQKKVFQVKK